ncbi:MAG: hypothetical protein M1572_03825 [Gammaproteobacteria bacterium]|nr:hypothetical protein [Gammaproteobacteria bacterium]
MCKVIELKKQRFIDMVNGDDCDLLELCATTAGAAFDDNKLIENLRNDVDDKIHNALYICVQATFQRARAFKEQKQSQPS